MDRRTFISASTGGILAARLAGGAHAPGRVATVGILSTVNPRTTTFTEGMVRRLRELGHVEGQNLVIEFRNAGGQGAGRNGRAGRVLVLLERERLTANHEAVPRAAAAAADAGAVQPRTSEPLGRHGRQFREPSRRGSGDGHGGGSKPTGGPAGEVRDGGGYLPTCTIRR